MHIVLGILGTIVTILFLLNRLAEAGIDIGWLNPFLWKRRRQWRHMLEGNPLFALDDPRELAALLVVGVAKVDGDVSSEEKKAVLEQFANVLSVNARTAAELFVSSAYMLREPESLLKNLGKVLPERQQRFDVAQARSILEMMERVAAVSGSASELQRELIDAVAKRVSAAAPSAWGV